MLKPVIIDADVIKKRIEEFEDIGGVIASHLIKELKQILSQSTPLIPEIEKAFDEGAGYLDITLPVECKKDYISNLKIK